MSDSYSEKRNKRKDKKREKRKYPYKKGGKFRSIDLKSDKKQK